MFKSYTNIKEIALLTSIYWLSAIVIWYLYGDITLTLMAKSKTFFVDLLIFIACFALVFILFISRDVFKICWDDKRIIFKYLLRKKKAYQWENISSMYYCPKFGVVHLIIATDDGEFYSIPDIHDKLYKALEKYAKVKIETIRHPMEVLPYLRERRKNARRERKS